MNTESKILERLQLKLSERSRIFITDPARRASAVLIPIYFKEGQLFILFTRRTELVQHHKGEISFPGGGFHPDDGSLLQTALRESQEEIGLEPADVSILGELDDMITRGSPFIISPFVGVIKPACQFQTSAFEIAEIIIIPIAALLQKGCCEEGFETIAEGQQIKTHVYAYQNCRITGATARILHQFLDIYTGTGCSA